MDLMLADGTPIERSHPLQGRPEPYGSGNGGGAGFEASRRRPERRAFEGPLFDHLPAGEERRQGFKQFAPPPKYANPRRTVGLVAREGVEVDIEPAHVERAM